MIKMATKPPSSANQLTSSLDLQRSFAEALTRVCQKSFAFVNFVHVTGRLSFNVDNDHVSHVTVSEIVKPVQFSSEGTEPFEFVTSISSETSPGVVPPIRIHKAKKPSVRTPTGRRRGRPPKKSFIQDDNWVTDGTNESSNPNISDADIPSGTGASLAYEVTPGTEDDAGSDPVEDEDDLDDIDSDYDPNYADDDYDYTLGKDRQKAKRKRGPTSNSKTAFIAKQKKLKPIYTCDRCSYSSPYGRVLAKHKLKHELEDSTLPPDIETEDISIPNEEDISIKNESDGADSNQLQLAQTEGDVQKGESEFLMSGEENDESGGPPDPEEKAKHEENEKSDNNKFKCADCPYETDHSGHYRDHLNRHKGIRPHKCETCEKTFTTADDLKRHAEIHNRSYECPLCSEEFESRELLKEHAKEEHGETGRLTMPTCKICKKRMPTASAIVKHMDEKHNNICSICGESFTHRPLLKKHREENHPVENLTCNLCGRKCSTKGALRKHIHRHREGTSFSCEICGKTFTAQSTLYHHKRGVHSDAKPYACDKCGKTFNFHHSLKLHILGHNGLRPHKCAICDKTYLTATHLKSHIEAVHSETKKFRCVICNKNFPYENSLRMHMMLHTGERPYCCSICGRGFVSRSAVKTHEASHISDKLYECDICKKKYKTDMLLRAHQRRHTTDGSRFMCDICGHTFMYKSNLEAHYTVHGEERRFACNVCGKSFKTHATLYSHKVVHKQDTPFSCGVCGKSFKSKERKLAHEKRHAGLKPFPCDQCSRCFPDKGGLSKHRKTVHAIAKKFACPVCGKTCARADNLRVHMRIHNDPSLLKMSHTDLMIKGDPMVQAQNNDLPSPVIQPDPIEIQQQLHFPSLIVPDQPIPTEASSMPSGPSPVTLPAVPPPPLIPAPVSVQAAPQLQTITIDASQLGLTASSHTPGPSTSVQLAPVDNSSQPQTVVLAPTAEEPKEDVSNVMTQSLTMLTPAQNIFQTPGSTIGPHASDYHAEVANAMLYMQYQTYLSAQGNVQPPQ